MAAARVRKGTLREMEVDSLTSAPFRLRKRKVSAPRHVKEHDYCDTELDSSQSHSDTDIRMIDYDFSDSDTELPMAMMGANPKKTTDFTEVARSRTVDHLEDFDAVLPQQPCDYGSNKGQRFSHCVTERSTSKSKKKIGRKKWSENPNNSANTEIDYPSLAVQPCSPFQENQAGDPLGYPEEPQNDFTLSFCSNPQTELFVEIKRPRRNSASYNQTLAENSAEEEVHGASDEDDADISSEGSTSPVLNMNAWSPSCRFGDTSSKSGHFSINPNLLRRLTTIRKRTCLEEIDITAALGISKSELTKQKISTRQMIVKAKLQIGGHLKFTTLEEYDIYVRAETYAANVQPNPDYYIIQETKPLLNDPHSSSLIHSRNFLSQNGIGMGFTRKRRKRTYDEECYVIHSPCGRVHNDSSLVLPEGTRLFRPPNKLVELVAQALNDSPDGMLQVQQVYTVIQNKYPYFKYMDKGSITSWRSSIRHALYQKWFKKIQFSTELINTKGCYWAINRKHNPREWTLPTLRPEMSLPDNYITLTKIMEEEANISNVKCEVLALTCLPDSFYEVQTMDQLYMQECDSDDQLMDVGYHLDVKTEDRKSTPDPDPMLTTMTCRQYSPCSQEQELQEYLDATPSPTTSDNCSEDSGYCSVWTSSGWEEYRDYPPSIINSLQVSAVCQPSMDSMSAITQPLDSMTATSIHQVELWDDMDRGCSLLESERPCSLLECERSCTFDKPCSMLIDSID